MAGEWRHSGVSANLNDWVSSPVAAVCHTQKKGCEANAPRTLIRFVTLAMWSPPRYGVMGPVVTPVASALRETCMALRGSPAGKLSVQKLPVRKLSIAVA